MNDITAHVKAKAMQSKADIVKASQTAEITARNRVKALREQVAKIRETAGNSPNEAQSRNIEYLGLIASEIEALIVAKRNEVDMYAHSLQATKKALDAEKGAMVAKMATLALEMLNQECQNFGA